MKINKIIQIVFLVLLLSSAAYLIILCLNMNSVINNTALTLQALQIKYNSLQQQTNLTSIILFGILLLIGFINYYISGNAKNIVLANLLYIPVTLYNFITLNFNFYKTQGYEPNENSGYWLIVFIGVFYIIGAILVSVIGFFTIRNLNKRSNSLKNK